jgi:hypothetical protein
MSRNLSLNAALLKVPVPDFTCIMRAFAIVYEVVPEPTATTGIWGCAESKLLSAQARILSAQPVPRGNSRHSPLGTAGPAQGSLPRATSDALGTRVP